MNALSLFSGIGGIDLACEWAGIETVAFCEREPFCQKVLRKHWPDIPIYDDVCTLTKERLEADGIGTIDLIHGGYPCQPFSTAGKREGAADDRHLWPEVKRLLEKIRPRWFVGENVAGHITLGLDDVLSDLDNLGYTTQPFVIPAAAVGARHRRDRVFIVAYTGHYEPQGWDEIAKGHKHLRGWETRGELTSCCNDVADTNSKWELQSQGAVRNIGRRFGNGSQSNGLRQWSIEPDVGRVANGVSSRVDRLKALGNAVVPAQIYPILAAIKQIDDMMH